MTPTPLIIPLLLFLAGATVLMGLFSPAYAIFPLLILFLVIVGFAFLPGSSSARINTGTARSDQDIAKEVALRLQEDPALHIDGIETTSRLGRVTLQGRVKSNEDKKRARLIAGTVPGVVDVSEQLHVAA